MVTHEKAGAGDSDLFVFGLIVVLHVSIQPLANVISNHARHDRNKERKKAHGNTSFLLPDLEDDNGCIIA